MSFRSDWQICQSGRKSMESWKPQIRSSIHWFTNGYIPTELFVYCYINSSGLEERIWSFVLILLHRPTPRGSSLQVKTIIYCWDKKNTRSYLVRSGFPCQILWIEGKYLILGKCQIWLIRSCRSRGFLMWHAECYVCNQDKPWFKKSRW